MVKKLKSIAKSNDKQLAEAIRTSAQQIWQAGLGAFAKAQEEGNRVFTKLVKEGTELQKRTQKLAENKVSGVTDTVTKMADNVSKQASGSWDKLEQVFEDRVSRALSRLGVPSKKDIGVLSKRVAELNDAVTVLTNKKKPVAKTAAKKATVKKATPKKTSSKQSSVKKTKSAKPAVKRAGLKLAAVKKTSPAKAVVHSIAKPEMMQAVAE